MFIYKQTFLSQGCPLSCFFPEPFCIYRSKKELQKNSHQTEHPFFRGLLYYYLGKITFEKNPKEKCWPPGGAARGSSKNSLPTDGFFEGAIWAEKCPAWSPKGKIKMPARHVAEPAWPRCNFFGPQGGANVGPLGPKIGPPWLAQAAGLDPKWAELAWPILI